jgi:hypothetical protein
MRSQIEARAESAVDAFLEIYGMNEANRFSVVQMYCDHACRSGAIPERVTLQQHLEVR